MILCARGKLSLDLVSFLIDAREEAGSGKKAGPFQYSRDNICSVVKQKIRVR